MTEAELLIRVKKGLGISGTYQDDTLQLHIAEVKEFLKDAGVPLSTINSDASVGVIIRGVSDIWNYKSGEVKFSDYFMKRTIQLAIRPLEVVENV